MPGLTKQRELQTMKFCFLLGKNVTDNALILKTAFKSDAMRKTKYYKWMVWSINDKFRFGRQSTAHIVENKIQNIQGISFTITQTQTIM